MPHGGGIQTSLVSLINAMAAPFRRQSGARSAPGGGAPILSYSWGQKDPFHGRAHTLITPGELVR